MSPTRNEFADYCCDLLATLGPCVARRMFGGYGISTEGLTVALLADLGQGEKLWLKADETSRARFQAAGCERFVYLAKGKAMSMNYYSAPDEAMDSPQLMAPWAQLALAAALSARQSKPTARRVAKAKAPSQSKTQPKPRLKAG
ncbi:MAG: TfoX/Sxy family protein [Burkholderiaceae bacterium]|nr:TfoX/Sxy family protein [Burkholderiaceae bacterium]